MKLFKSLFFILTIFSVLNISGCSSSNSTLSTDITQTESSKLIQTNTSSSLLVYGEVKIDEIEEIQLSFPARITDILVKKGDTVNKEDPLIALDFNDYNLQITTLEKELEGYQLELSELQNSTNAEAANLDAISSELALKKSYVTSGQDPDILPLKNNLTTLNNDLKEAQKLYDSYVTLYETGSISEQELTSSKLAVDKLKQQIANTNTSIQKIADARDLEISTLQSKLNAVTLEVGNIDSSKASKISQLQVKIESTLLTLQNMKDKLSSSYLKGHQIIAPKDNLIIYDINTSSGASVSGLGYPLIQFMDLNELYVMVEIPEESLSQVKLNVPVTLKIADNNIPVNIEGTVSSLSSYAVEKEGDIVVEAHIDITKGIEYLMPGLSIDAYIEVS